MVPVVAEKFDDGSAPVLGVYHCSKTFPGQVAVCDASMELRAGEIRGLVGQNGSGKSTLIKCMAGYHTADPGATFALDGREVPPPSSGANARLYGFAFVHQDLGLVPTLSILENIGLVRGWNTRWGRISWRAERRSVSSLLEAHGMSLSPDTLVSRIGQVEKTLVAVIRSLQGVRQGARLLVLDEPTASLPKEQVDRLFTALRDVKKTGVAIIYISHKLDEVFELADRVTVMRGGAIVGTYEIASLTHQTLVEYMIGRPLATMYPEASHRARSAIALELSDVAGDRIRSLSLRVRYGELVGVAGLLGAGKSELTRLISGAQRVSGGIVRISEKEVKLKAPADGIRHGVVLVPQDRRGKGLIPTTSVRENLTLMTLRKGRRSFLRISRRREESSVRRLMDDYNVLPRNPELPITQLSGGNQQKAVLARVMASRPRILVLDEPVQGVDVSARAEIHILIERVKTEGAAVIMASAEIDDLAQMCDRVVVMRDGSIVDELTGRNLTEDKILQAALGAPHVANVDVKE